MSHRPASAAKASLAACIEVPGQIIRSRDEKCDRLFLSLLFLSLQTVQRWVPMSLSEATELL